MEQDNIQKACIFDIRKYAVNDGPGIRTTVFFKGCPLRCIWCHNPEGLHPEPENICEAKSANMVQAGEYKSVSEIMPYIIQDKIFYEESNGGVTFSGGEPLMQKEFLKEISKKCNEKKIHVCIDTCGFAEKNTIQSLIPFVNCWLYDIKLMDDKLHQKYTGVSNKKILENLLLLHQEKQKIIIRIPLITGITATLENATAIAEFFKKNNFQYPVHLLPLHKMGREKYERLQMPNPYNELENLNESVIRQWIEIFKNYHYYPIIIR